MAEQELDLSSKIDAGVKVVIATAIERHRKLGESISIMQDDQVITLTAKEIPTIQNIQKPENNP